MQPSLNKYIMPTVKIYFSVIAANEDEKKLKQEFHTALEKIRKVPIVKGLDPLDYILKGVDDFIGEYLKPATLAVAEESCDQIILLLLSCLIKSLIGPNLCFQSGQVCRRPECRR